MRKKIFITLCCVAPLCFCTAAIGADGPYVSANVGVAALSDSDLSDSTLPGLEMELSYDAGWTIGGAIGYRISSFRIEGELAYQMNDIDQTSFLGLDLDSTGDVTGTAFLVNGYYDFVNNSAFTPFIGVGIGYASVEINDYNIPGSGVPDYSDDDTVFAYQMGVGVGYAVNENLTLDLRYRYFATEDPSFDTTEVEVASHNFMAGLRYNF